MMNRHAVIPSREAASLDPATSRRLSTLLAVVGVAGLVLSGIGFASDRSQFFHSYLVAFMFCASLSLGGLFFTVVQYLVGAKWSIVVRRIPETFMANFGVLAVLFVPILFGLHDLYHWMDQDAVAKDAILQGKAPYLNTTFFIVRLVVYFGVWIAISSYFYRKSIAVDETGDVALVQRMRAVSAPSVLLYALTQTFAAFDLLMSLEPHWYSTIFGVYFFAGTAVTSFAVIAIVALYFRSKGKLTDEITPEHYHDLGKLMFAFTVFWTYIAFSQYFLIWYGNLPEETVFFLHRWEGSWKPFSLLLLFGHFVFPFVMLMSKHAKRQLHLLGFMALWIIFIQLVDMYWLIMPSLHKGAFSLHWLDISCLLGVFGVYAAFVARRFGQHALVPVHDPLLLSSLEFENV